MTHWNYRVIKKNMPDGSAWYSIHEAYYNANGSLRACTENPTDVSGESVEELKQSLHRMLVCLDQEILIDGKMDFVDQVKDSGSYRSGDGEA